MEHDEVTSLTISTEETLLTAVIEAQEDQYVATCNIPNTLVQKCEGHANTNPHSIRGFDFEVHFRFEPHVFLLKFHQKL